MRISSSRWRSGGDLRQPVRRRGAMSAAVSGSSVKPSSAPRRAPRSRRSGSRRKASSRERPAPAGAPGRAGRREGSMTGRASLRRRPPAGMAMASIVKSRSARSASISAAQRHEVDVCERSRSRRTTRAMLNSSCRATKAPPRASARRRPSTSGSPATDRSMSWPAGPGERRAGSRPSRTPLRPARRKRRARRPAAARCSAQLESGLAMAARHQPPLRGRRPPPPLPRRAPARS